MLSIRQFAGRERDAPVIVNLVGGCDPGFRRRVTELGAELRVVEPMEGETGFGNKLRMLDLHENRDFDVLLALDCDVVVVGDPSDYIARHEVGAKPVDYDRFNRRDWQKLCGLVGVSMPPKTLRDTKWGKPIRPYFNSGVLTVPRGLCAELARRWTESYATVVTTLEAQPDFVPRNYHWLAEQFSLSLGLLRGEIPVRPLPLRMNFPSHVRVHRSARRAGAAPVVIHYHHEVDERGFLLAPRCDLATPAAERFNRHRAEKLELEYRGIARRSRAARVRAIARRRLRRTVMFQDRLRTVARDLGLPSGRTVGVGEGQRR